jgi:hypothetical protein
MGGGGGIKVSNSLPNDDFPLTCWPASLSKVRIYKMAANTEQNGYLKDGHEHYLFQEQTDRQTTLLKHGG